MLGPLWPELFFVLFLNCHASQAFAQSVGYEPVDSLSGWSG
jgi:hypothetical protein